MSETRQIVAFLMLATSIVFSVGALMRGPAAPLPSNGSPAAAGADYERGYRVGYSDAEREARRHQTAVECVQGGGTVVPDADGYPHCVRPRS